MQPYFFPYIGYFQLISAVDLFIVYDNIQFTKKGWINRNRILQNGKDTLFSLPLKADSDFLNIEARELASNFDKRKLLNQIRGAYQKAPYFSETFALLEKIIEHDDTNLFSFIRNSIVEICEHLSITTTIKNSAVIAIDHSLKSQDKVLALCHAVNATTYINAIGGIDLYSVQAFQSKQIELKFIKPTITPYQQFDSQFIPALSIIDVMMFNQKELIVNMLQNYTLL